MWKYLGGGANVASVHVHVYVLGGNVASFPVHILGANVASVHVLVYVRGCQCCL